MLYWELTSTRLEKAPKEWLLSFIFDDCFGGLYLFIHYFSLLAVSCRVFENANFCSTAANARIGNMLSGYLCGPLQGHVSMEEGEEAGFLSQMASSQPQLSPLHSDALESLVIPCNSSQSSFQCERCKKVFTRPSSVVRHQASCQSVSLIPCEWCDRSFTRIDNLQRHVKKKHSCQSNYKNITWTVSHISLTFRSKI